MPTSHHTPVSSDARLDESRSLLGDLGLGPGTPAGTLSERRLLRRTVMACTDRRATVLDDVEIPGCRHRIDHVVIAPHGLWVLATVGDRGPIEVRDVGGFFRSESRLFVEGRDRTTTLDSLAWQQAAVAQRLAADPTTVRVRSAVVVMGDDDGPSCGAGADPLDADEILEVDGHRVLRLTALGRVITGAEPERPDAQLGQAAIARLAGLLVEDPTAVGVGRATLDLTRRADGNPDGSDTFLPLARSSPS